MATYFHGSTEIQAAVVPSDGIQTLYLMNPNYISYTDTSHHQQQQYRHHPPNMLFFNPAAATAASTGALNLASASLPHAQSITNHQLLGIPHPAGPASNIWPANTVDQVSPVAPDDAISSQMRLRLPVAKSPARQGLSLSLSTQQVPWQQEAPYNRAMINDHDQIQVMHGHVSAVSPAGREEVRVSGNSLSSASNAVSGMQSVVMGSKYLRAAQELLDEVINVGKGIKGDFTEATKEKTKFNKESGDETSGGSGGESSDKRGAELSTAQKQVLQMKKAKLVDMLDEVEQRYRQYHHQMQLVVSSFKQAAGFSAVKSYTSLTLRTISKHFRCLRDAISIQIKSTGKSLGEQDCLGVKTEGSRLRYVDHQLRRQRALQQLGLMQHNAWRPQKGLPERAVSVLRAWLFEHFLHPYPNDSDKHMLAKQTGLTRSQVSNWFINARVRLWKPMVEEMYLEEMKEHEKNGSEESNGKDEKVCESSPSAPRESSTLLQMDQLKDLQSKTVKSSTQNASPTDFSNSAFSMSRMRNSAQAQVGFSLITSSEMEGSAHQISPKKPRSNIGDKDSNSPGRILSLDMEMKHGEITNREINVNFGGERSMKDGYPLITSTTSGFGAYPTGDLGRFHPDQLAPRLHWNGVSLTLGLQHCDGLSLSGTQQNFLSNQNITQLGRGPEMGTTGMPDFCGIITSQNSHSGEAFENIEIQNRKRIAAQLLPDFVA